METYYLRLEGVNLANFLEDTADLSTIRGGGLLLLDAVKHVQQQMQSVKLEPLSLGASSGLFRFQVTGKEDAEKVREDMEKALRRAMPGKAPDGSSASFELRHATFVVDCVPSSGDERFVADREALLARNRWRQLRQPSLAIPSQNMQPGALACWIDRVRPGPELMVDPQNVPRLVSASVKTRREYGRAQKQAFYEKETRLKLGEFAQDFDELTDAADWGNLNHKMAVIYIDGNGFSSLQDELCKTPSRQKDFDEYVRTQRQSLLRALLKDVVQSDPTNSWVTKDRRFRLETLLWGGDEMIWVVPAWQGWKVLRFFYEYTRGQWQPGGIATPGGSWAFQSVPLRHAAGLVFCHHNAPISRVTKLAKELAGLAKRKGRGSMTKCKAYEVPDLFAYQVLESFDHIGGDLEHHLTLRCRWDPNLESLILPGKAMHDIEEQLPAFREGFPRRKLHQIVYALEKDGWNTAKGIVNEVKAQLGPKPTRSLEQLSASLRHPHTQWLHLLELWDYVAPNNTGQGVA